MRAVKIFVGLKPGRTRCKRRKLLTSNPAVASRTNASTISTTTRAERVRRPRAPSLEPRVVSFKVPARSLCDARQAGSRPASIPTNKLTAPVKTRTRKSGEISPMRGMLEGRKPRSESIPQTARTNPARPPKTPSSALSVSSRFTICQRPAPSAARMPISFWRESERARRRLATLTHATRSTHPAIAHNISRAGLVSPTTAVRRGTRVTATCAFESGYCCRSEALIASILACACPRETPGFSRATQNRKSFPRCSVIGCEPSADSRRVATVVQSSAATLSCMSGKLNPAGITPTTA